MDDLLRQPNSRVALFQTKSKVVRENIHFADRKAKIVVNCSLTVYFYIYSNFCQLLKINFIFEKIFCL